ncbi:Nn.00g060880.m01.CDS01 [Neocucurbitaria sp. VM-36]
MTTTTTDYTLSAPNNKHETAKGWLKRHLRKAASRQTLTGSDGNSGIHGQLSFKRPQTAPSTGPAAQLDIAPRLPPIPINIERASPRPSIQVPPHPQRPDPGVMRDVSAWLDASMSSRSPPIMGGLSYWRTASIAGVKVSVDIQHAIPIVRDPEAERPSTSNSQQLKSFRRRAKKIQVQMPSLLRTKRERLVTQKRIDRRSASMPLIAISYEEARKVAPPTLFVRSRSFLHPSTRPSTSNTPTQTSTLTLASSQSHERLPPFRRGTPASTRLDDAETNMERRVNAMFRPAGRRAESARPSTATAGLTREDSMGDLSDAPTYFTGPPPPSYRSRTGSILTMSSFGCIDGMNSAQRQLSQQRAAQQRGMKGRMKKFARSFKT